MIQFVSTILKGCGLVMKRTNSLQTQLIRTSCVYCQLKCIGYYRPLTFAIVAKPIFLLIPSRFKHFKKEPAGTSKAKDASSSVDDIDKESDDEDEVTDAADIHFDEDNEFPSTFKDMKTVQKSMRLDALVGFAFNISRSKVEDYFLQSKLRINGKTALKKALQVSVGDAIDLIMEQTETTIKVKRLRVVKAERRKATDDFVIYIRAWKSAVSISADN